MTDPPDIDELVARLRTRVEERRRRGDYPDDVESDLGSHFRRVLADRDVDLGVPEVQVEMLRAVSHFSSARIDLTSRMPAGDAVHKVAGKLVARQTEGVLHQVQEFADVLVPSVLRLIEVLDGPVRAMQREFSEQIAALADQVAETQLEMAGLRHELADARREVEKVRNESAEALGRAHGVVAGAESRLTQFESSAWARRLDPWFETMRFDDEFRGQRDEVRNRYIEFADLFVGFGPVLDIGCGRGEFVELMVDRGVDVRGVELDAELVTFCRDRGLPVEAGDGLAVLDSVDDGSLGGLVMLQVVEHLTAQQVVDLVATAARKVRRGGRVVIETVNPQSLYVYAHSFYLDPTHSVPIHPAYLTFLFREAGFDGVRVDWRSLPSESERLQLVERPEGSASEVANENFRRLNELLYAPQDYAVVAFR